MKAKVLSNFTLLLSVVLSVQINAQVTIGSNQVPNPGALLDLKEGTLGNNATTTRGLGLPRVELTKLNPANADELAQSIGNTTGSYDVDDHIGLCVYNIQADYCSPNPIHRGPYVWDGNYWQYLGIDEASNEVSIFTDPRDGQKYRYRNFGAVAGDWMLENMRATTYAQGSTAPILSAVGSETVKKYCYPAPAVPLDPLPGTSTGAIDGTDPYYYNQQPAMGLLYNWAAVINMGTETGEQPNPGDVNQGEISGGNPDLLETGHQGICPDGWHVPSDKEWNELEAEIADNPTKYSSNSGTSWNPAWATTSSFRPDFGESMKSPCPVPYRSNSTGGKSNHAFMGGFDILLPGAASGPENDPGVHNVYGYGLLTPYWTAASRDTISAWSRSFMYINNGVGRFVSNRHLMFPVRCKKD